jgi:hypothetical protein
MGNRKQRSATKTGRSLDAEGRPTWLHAAAFICRPKTTPDLFGRGHYLTFYKRIDVGLLPFADIHSAFAALLKIRTSPL